jgi:hypothetical protein
MSPWSHKEWFEGGTLPPQSLNLVTCEGKFEGSTGLKYSSEICPDSYITKSILGKNSLKDFPTITETVNYS